MKTLKFLCLFVTLSSFTIGMAQKIEKKAEKISAEMTKVMSLSEDESKVVYNIQLERFRTSKKIKSTYEEGSVERKEKLKALGNKVFNNMKKAVGKEKLQIWKAYKKSKN